MSVWRVIFCGERVFGDRVRCGEKEGVGSKRRVRELLCRGERVCVCGN